MPPKVDTEVEAFKKEMLAYKKTDECKARMKYVAMYGPCPQYAKSVEKKT